MGLFSFLQRSSASDNERTGTADPVQVARSRARRRLIGAAVLLGIGVVGFPLLFETQPRPIPVDIPIEIPRKDTAPLLPLPPPRASAAARVSSGVTDRETPAAPVAAPSRAETAAPRAEPAARTEPVSRSTSAASAADAEKPAARGDDGTRARALLDGQDAARKPAVVAANTATDAAEPTPAAAGRFVVQVAAYGEASLARNMRQRIDKLGLKSYSQVAQVDGAKRIRVRVGPFTSREDADKAAATLKAAGLPAAVLAL